jgi:ABC-type sugar transport system permease subunit
MSPFTTAATWVKRRTTLRLGLSARRGLWGYVFLGPALLILLIFKIVPMAQAA